MGFTQKGGIRNGLQSHSTFQIRLPVKILDWPVAFLADIQGEGIGREQDFDF